MISFSEIAANRISQKQSFLNGVRLVGLFVAAFGILVNIAGFDLGNLWAFSDLANIIIVYFNVPLLFLGARYVLQATEHYRRTDGASFTGDLVGIQSDCWNHKH